VPEEAGFSHRGTITQQIGDLAAQGCGANGFDLEQKLSWPTWDS
jgi:hypothetical protein